MNTHPAADLFPMMADDDLQALADDIREHGLRQPIVRDSDGLIVDGRNRLLACELAGVEPEFATCNGADPVALVVSLNVKRRNLTKQQRAVIAAEAWEMISSGTNTEPRAKKLARLFDVNHAYIFREYLARQAAAGELEDVLDELARSAVKHAVRSRAWQVTGQGALFDPDALFSLGEGHHIRMGEARAAHVLRHGEILTENYERQSTAYFAKHRYISSRLPQLFERGCTLAELEALPAEATA